MTQSVIAARGTALISQSQGLSALATSVCPCGPAPLAVVSFTWDEMAVEQQRSALLSLVAPKDESQQLQSVCAVSLDAVLKMVKEIAGSAVGADSPLMEAGIDSLGAVELGNQLKQAVGSDLPSTLMFDAPTARQMAAMLQPAVSASGTGEADFDVSRPVLSGQVAIGGLSVMLPLGMGTRSSIWCTYSTGQNSVTQVPASRWKQGGRALAAPIACRARHGGFVHTAELFDNLAFGVSRAEACAMDPQQRLLLERGYSALHEGSLDRASLAGSLTGVFVGIVAAEFDLILAVSPAAGSVYGATGSSHSVATGRLSYILGLHGPCIACDTACSAVLAASHLALRALQLSECYNSLVGGVNLMLLPDLATRFAVAGMTSPLGKCHTFDARADGYARGESCGGLMAHRVGSATPPSFDPRLSGSAVRQDGRSASLTAPNGQAQQGLVTAALNDAGLGASAFVLVEAHGTGTVLGDPIEAGSVSGAVFAKRGHVPAALGGAKANAGHAEAAAGLAGLLRLALSLGRAKVTPNAQL
eukprot:6874066-Prymnesium_polylepis.1